MRILQLHNRQYGYGGADIQIERDAERLEARGHTVEAWYVDNRDIERVGLPRAAVKAVWNHDAVKGLRARVEAFKPDVVHGHTPFPIMSPAVFVATHRLGLPLVVTSHAFRYHCIEAHLLRDGEVCELCVGKRIKYPGVVHRCYKDSLPGSLALTTSLALHRNVGTFHRAIDRFVALTPFNRDLLVREGIDPAKLVVIPQCPPDSGPPTLDRGGYALFAGRFEEEKGVPTLLAAWRSLDADVPLVVAGAGALEPQVAAAAKDDQRITLLGWQDADQMRDLMRHAEVFLMTSEWYEGFGMVITESFAAGTPVIASDVGNFCEMVDPGRNGERYRSADPADLARVVASYFATADRDAYQAAARQTFETRYHPDLQTDALERVYAEAIAARADRR